MNQHNFRLFARWIALTVCVALWGISTAYAQQEKSQPPVKKSTTAVFPDEYSDLDDNSSTRANTNEAINQKLEQARQYYLRGLSQIERSDTLKAGRLFESAIDVLNELASTPGIEQNEDYTYLAQAIIEDYESYIRSIDKLSEDSPLFVMRERMFQEVEAQAKPGIQPLKGNNNEATPQPKGEGNLITTIPLTQNEFVSKGITFLTTSEKGKQFFRRVIERTGKWFPMLKRIAKEENMPEEIIHLAMIESALNPKAVSWARAVGMWQFIQSTGELYNLKVNQWLDERRDPEKATRAAMRHLRDLYNELGDWHLALAAYNCGAGGVKRAIKQSGLENPDFWQVREFLPRETRSYVPMFIAATLVTLQYEAYGFKNEELNFEQEYQYDSYVVKEPVSLKALAKCAGMTMDEFRLLNPELLRNSTPPDMEYRIKIPSGAREDFSSSYAALTPEEKQPWITHEVRKGETLASIATMYGVTVADITGSNNIRKLKRGQVLRIPTDAVTTAKPSLDSLSVASSTPPAAPANGSQMSSPQIKNDQIKNDAQPSVAENNTVSTKATPSATQTVSNGKRIIHVVKDGETLFSISQRYGVRPADVRNWNNLSYDENTIQNGSTLVIMAAGSDKSTSDNSARNTASAAPATEENTTVKESKKEEKTIAKLPRQVTTVVQHTVRRGETLAQIADDYSTSIQSITKLNNLKPKRGLMAGQVLKIQTVANVNENRSLAASKSSQNEADETPTGTLKKHKVKRGESIGTVAALYGVRESQLVKWNPSLRDGVVNAGEYLKVYTEQSAKGSSAATPKTVNKLPKTYTVRNGDTMFSIARKYGVSVEQLEAKNKSLKNGVIRPGQKVRIQ